MTEQELRERLNRMTGEIPAETHRAFLSAACPGKEARIVKRKISAGLVFALVLILVTVAAIAAGIVYDLKWWYGERTAETDPEFMRKMAENLVAEPEQQQTEDSLVDVKVREVSWMPDEGKLVVSIQATAKDPEHFELHSRLALDVDGAYDPDFEPDMYDEECEGHAEHWLWRENTDPEADERFRCGPVPQMMDDSSKHLLLFEGLQLAPLERPELFGYASMDELRTPEGEVLYLFEYSQDWMKQDYDRQMEEYIEEYPNMKEYAESQIAKAREARETLNGEGISCMLSYRVVEYIEGMDDTELYAGGTEGQVTFAIRTGK